MGKNLARGVQDVVTLRSDAVNVVDDPRKLAAFIRTFLLLHKLLKAILGKLFVLYVVRLMLLCTNIKIVC